MSRYIEVEEAVDRIGQILPKRTDSDYQRGIAVGMSLAKIEIEGVPTADVVPVKHGHWYVYETGYEDTEAKCSICGFETLVNEPGNGLHMARDLKYCPRCGALMDLEVTE